MSSQFGFRHNLNKSFETFVQIDSRFFIILSYTTIPIGIKHIFKIDFCPIRFWVFFFKSIIFSGAKLPSKCKYLFKKKKITFFHSYSISYPNTLFEMDCL